MDLNPVFKIKKKQALVPTKVSRLLDFEEKGLCGKPVKKSPASPLWACQYRNKEKTRLGISIKKYPGIINYFYCKHFTFLSCNCLLHLLARSTCLTRLENNLPLVLFNQQPCTFPTSHSPPPSSSPPPSLRRAPSRPPSTKPASLAASPRSFCLPTPRASGPCTTLWQPRPQGPLGWDRLRGRSVYPNRSRRWLLPVSEEEEMETKQNTKKRAFMGWSLECLEFEALAYMYENALICLKTGLVCLVWTPNKRKSSFFQTRPFFFFRLRHSERPCLVILDSPSPCWSWLAMITMGLVMDLVMGLEQTGSEFTEEGKRSNPACFRVGGKINKQQNWNWGKLTSFHEPSNDHGSLFFFIHLWISVLFGFFFFMATCSCNTYLFLSCNAWYSN